MTLGQNSVMYKFGGQSAEELIWKKLYVFQSIDWESKVVEYFQISASKVYYEGGYWVAVGRGGLSSYWHWNKSENMDNDGVFNTNNICPEINVAVTHLKWRIMHMAMTDWNNKQCPLYSVGFKFVKIRIERYMDVFLQRRNNTYIMSLMHVILLLN